MRDKSELIDEQCEEYFRHTNWGYLDTYTKKELESNDHDLEDNIVFWHKEAQKDLPYGWFSCEECQEEFEGKIPTCNCIEEIAQLKKVKPKKEG